VRWTSYCILRRLVALFVYYSRSEREERAVSAKTKNRDLFFVGSWFVVLQISGNTSSGDGDDVVDRPRLRVGNTNLPP
jgi:hypothetical protein